MTDETIYLAHCRNCFANDTGVGAKVTTIIGCTVDPDEARQWNLGHRTMLYPCAVCGEKRPGAMREEEDFYHFVMNGEEGDIDDYSQ